MDQTAYEMTVRADGKEQETILQDNHSRITHADIHGAQASEFSENGKGNTDKGSPKPWKRDVTTSPLLALKKYIRQPSSLSSSTSSTIESPLSSQQSNIGVDCAGLILKCLFCRFYDMLLMIPESCEGVVNLCCPTYKQFSSTMESMPNDGSNSNMDCDWGLFSVCEDASDCLELAMEISEICYH